MEKPNEDITRLAREKIGEFIDILRKDRKATWTDIEHATGMSRQTLQAVLKGSANYNIDSLIKVMQVLDIRIEFMLKDPERTFPDLKNRRN